MNKSVAAQADNLARGQAHKRYSVKLPIALAARLDALCEMHPHKSRDQVLGDLLGLGLSELERQSIQAAEGRLDIEPDIRKPVYLLSSPFAEFRDLVRRHHYALEQSLAKEVAEPEFRRDAYQLDDRE